ncbi:MAG: 50S ribosomal protein L11 [archaeon]
MAKETVDALIAGGKASAAPPLGPALGPKGVNISKVIAEINKKTEAFKGMQVPVKVIIDTDTKEFSIEIGTPPAASLIKKEAKIDKGSGRPQEEHVADLVIEQIIKIAKMKEDSLLGKTLKEKVREIIGTCNSMGVKVEGKPAVEALKLVAEGKFDKEIKEEKTEISAQEQKELEEEKKKMQADLAEKHAELEATANSIIKSMEGKERSAIKTKLTESGIPESLITKLLPAEVAPAAGKAKPAEGAKKPEAKK